MYYSGSRGYGYDEEDSDIDVTVVLENFKGSLHLQLGKLDIFAFSKDMYIKRQNFDETVIDYYKSATDDILVPEDKILYLSPEFEETYEQLKSFNVKRFIVNQITALLNHTKIRMNISMELKSHYHLLRYRGILEHYDRTGVFELVIDEPWRSEMLQYKKNWDNEIGKSYENKLVETFEYLEQYRDRMIINGLDKHY
jgi:hypothetical protein